ncbi:cardiolipin synthase [Mesorhizobium sp. KR9-304]|uniref:cardiolipin synthase n=1 Tax=Mesorhizobium sp. KR9-304 TaxID=3156614 RepID=UPI0032B313A1
MSSFLSYELPGVYPALSILLTLGVMARIMLRPNRTPASRVAWLVVVGAVPLLGIVAYVLLGEVNIGRRRVARVRAALAQLPAYVGEGSDDVVPERYRNLFRLGHSVSGFWPVGGNTGRLLADSNAAIDAMVADIDAAKDQVHLLFYIWLADNNGCKVIEALKRAAVRGVTCRVMVDDIGSRALVRSPHWQAMSDVGIKVASGLAVGNPLLRVLTSRIDLRNHRKIVVIDGTITYCGSQNCADPEFLVKARYAPWVDAMVRFEGPIAHQNQLLFAGDWTAGVREDLSDLLRPPAALPDATDMPAQVIGTGPTVRYSAMQEVFQSLLFAARREIIVTTPYYVPDDALQTALCASAYRGVDTTIIFPARNDSWIVGWASHSYYPDLLAAGVKIHEYVGGLLHTKSLTVDGELLLIGSANMDRRSLELNYENNILVYDPELTEAMRTRQKEYLAISRQVTRQEVEGWSMPRKLINNTVALVGPLF